MYGYIYFSMYKGIKFHLKEKDLFKTHKESTSAKALVYATSSTIAEITALCVYYPFELVKIRLLTRNDHFGYTSVTNAFYKIWKNDGIKGLYRGVFTFFLAFMGQYTLQMVTYELKIDSDKKKVGIKYFNEHENFYVIWASIISGVIAAILINALEVIVVRKQTTSGETFSKIYKEEGIKIFTKGI